MQAQDSVLRPPLSAGISPLALLGEERSVKRRLSLDRNASLRVAKTAEISEPSSRLNSAVPNDKEALYSEFQPLVRRLMRQYGENQEIRNDLEGEIYYRFHLIVDAYDASRGVPLRPYIVRQLSASIYSYARHYWRRQSREISLDAVSPAVAPQLAGDPTRDWDNSLELDHVQAILPQAISKLSDRQRDVVVLRYYEDWSFEEIALKLNVKPATARSLLRHALNHLREDMKAGRDLG